MSKLENNTEVTGSNTGNLSEILRRQYLNSMGIQTWFDPSIDVSQFEVVVKPEEKPRVIEVSNQENISPKVEQSIQQSLENKANQEPISSVNNIHALNAKIEQCELCELHIKRKHAICGEGDINADLFIIVDAPVSDEISNNSLFSIIDKAMLQSMLKTIDFELSSVYITSLVKCSPPDQRSPQTSEMICCDDHLTEQIKIIKPKAIMLLGEKASQQLLLSQKSLTDLRLRHHKHLDIPVFASYHPNDLFASSETKRKVWADLLQIRKQLI